MAGGGAGSGVGVRERDRCRHLRGSVRVAAGRRDRHGCLERNVGVLAAHRAAIDEPAAIWLALGYGYARPAGLKVRRESTAIAGWPDHDASVALPPPKGAATRGVLTATGRGRPSEASRWAVALCDEPSGVRAHAVPPICAPAAACGVADAAAPNRVICVSLIASSGSSSASRTSMSLWRGFPWSCDVYWFWKIKHLMQVERRYLSVLGSVWVGSRGGRGRAHGVGFCSCRCPVHADGVSGGLAGVPAHW
jgi:hypothetical protein